MSEELNEGSPLDPNGQEEVLSEVESLKKALSEAKEKEKDVFDQLLRLTAEFQNFRKRSEARIIDSRKAGKEDVLLPIISLTDALIQAESSSRHATNVESLKKGLTMVLGQFEKFLADQGLVQIKAKGEKMDPSLHEAIARVPSEELEEGMIVDEIQRGYTLNGQLVRPARVSVAAQSIETAEAKFKEEN